MDINKIIMESISNVMNEANLGERVGRTIFDTKEKLKKGLEGVGEKIYDTKEKARKGLEGIGAQAYDTKEEARKGLEGIGIGIHDNVEGFGREISGEAAKERARERARMEQEEERNPNYVPGTGHPRYADAEEAARIEKRLDQDDIEASRLIQQRADEEAAEKARKAAGLDVGVDTHLRRAINRAGQALGIERSKWDTEAAEAGVQTHLARAGRRAWEAVRTGEPAGIAGAAATGIAAGLGALALAKKLREAKSRGAKKASAKA